MSKASDNPFPSLLFAETVAPADPAAGTQRLFIDPADHLLKSIDSAGTVTVQGGGVANLADLGDVDLTGLADGDVLVWDMTTSKWIVATGGGGSTTLAALTDVDLTGLADGDVLVWDTATSKWIVGAPSGGGTGTVDSVTAGDTTVTIGGTTADPTVVVNTTTEAERIRDVIGAALTAGANVTLTVNDAGDTITVAVSGLDDSVVAPVAPNDQTGTTYTFVLADGRRLVTGNSASAQTFTIPPNSSVPNPLGTILEVYQKGAGAITLAAGAGVTLRTPRGAKTAVQYAQLSARQVATDIWVIGGDTTT